MAKKSSRNTKARIVSAAWKLFYEQGYEETTVEEIIESSQTSKGSFYHYFDGKDALLSTLSDLFDQKYQDLQAVMPPEMPTTALQPGPFCSNQSLVHFTRSSVTFCTLNPIDASLYVCVFLTKHESGRPPWLPVPGGGFLA